MPQSSQFSGSQQVPSVPGTPSLSQPVHSPALAGQPAQPSSMQVPQAQAGSFAGHPAQPSSFNAPSMPPPHVQPPAVPARPALPTGPSLHAAGSAAVRSARHVGLHMLLTKPSILAMAVVVLAGTGAGIGYSMYRASAPTSFVIATDRGNNQIVRIDLATRNMTVLLSNKVLPGSPDSAVFINDTQMLIDFPCNGEVGIGDIQHGTYTSIGTSLGGSLRDMALRPDGSGMLIADTNGTILGYHVGSRKVSTFV